MHRYVESWISGRFANAQRDKGRGYLDIQWESWDFKGGKRRSLQQVRILREMCSTLDPDWVVRQGSKVTGALAHHLRMAATLSCELKGRRWSLPNRGAELSHRSDVCRIAFDLGDWDILDRGLDLQIFRRDHNDAG
jgi:hypothetical protein